MVSQHRGQAFETMMLVISVIIAVAILGILTGFLGGITFGATKAGDVISNGLSQVQQRGIGFSEIKKAEFSAGTIITTATVIGEAPIQAENIIFECADDTICAGGEDSPLERTDTKMTATSKVTVNIVVCRGPSGDKKYHVCIGSELDPKATSDYCSEKCELG